MSIWDDPDLQAGGEFVSFEDLGDSIAGVVTAVRTHRFDDGKVVPQILLLSDDGEDRTVTAGQVRLKAQLAEQRPEAGDHVRITLTNIEKRSGGKTLKHFEVIVTRTGAAQAVPPTLVAGNALGWQSPQAAPPAFVPQAAPAPAAPPAAAPVPAAPAAIDPAAAMAALANLTHEQKVALGIAV